MYLYKKTIHPKNKAGKLTALLCLISGTALFILSNADLIMFPAIAQILGLILLTCAVYVASAYLLREYTFSVEPGDRRREDGSPEYEFRITEHKGKMTYTTCRIALSEIISVKVIDANNKKLIRKERKPKKKYTYDTQFAASHQIEIAAEIDSEEISVIITYDDELLSTLKYYFE